MDFRYNEKGNQGLRNNNYETSMFFNTNNYDNNYRKHGGSIRPLKINY